MLCVSTNRMETKMRMSSFAKKAGRLLPVVIAVAFLLPGGTVRAQSFNFEQLEKTVQEFSVIIEIKVELSFGTHSNEQEERLMGTVVSSDGLILFDGTILSQDNIFSSLSGMDVRTEAKRIQVRTFDGKEFDAEFIGTDRFTQLGFIKVSDPAGFEFTPVSFSDDYDFKVGDWLALYALLPEFVTPPLHTDIGMISANVVSPEEMPLLVGFSPLESASVLFNEALQPVGVLGMLTDPSRAQTDASGLIESFGEYDIPLMGVVTAERLQELISDPPRKGEIDRAWLGISLQALTKDIAEFLGIDLNGGIIVNDVISGSPAAGAGLMIGDVIYEVNGMVVEVNREEKLSIFQRKIAEMGPDAMVEFSVIRPGETSNQNLKLTAVLERAPLSPSDAPDYEDKSLELTVRELVFADYNALNQDRDSFKGVAVSGLKRGGLAMLGGLMIGDVVQRIANHSIETLEDATAALKQISEEKPREVIFFVWRDNKTMFVNIKTDWQ